MEFVMKWVHMARYELILTLLRLDGVLWLPIVSGPHLIPKGLIQIQNRRQVRTFDSIRLTLRTAMIEQ